MCQQWVCNSSDYLRDDERLNFDKNDKRRQKASFLAVALSFGWQLRNVLPGGLWESELSGGCALVNLLVCLSVVFRAGAPVLTGMVASGAQQAPPFCSGSPGRKCPLPQGCPSALARRADV